MLNVTTISFFIRYHRIAAERLPQVWQTSNLKIRTFLVAAAMLIVRTHVLRSYDKWLTNLTTWERLYFTKEHTFISSTFFAISKHKIRFLMYKRVHSTYVSVCSFDGKCNSFLKDIQNLKRMHVHFNVIVIMFSLESFQSIIWTYICVFLRKWEHMHFHIN